MKLDSWLSGAECMDPREGGEQEMIYKNNQIELIIGLEAMMFVDQQFPAYKSLILRDVGIITLGNWI